MYVWALICCVSARIKHPFGTGQTAVGDSSTRKKKLVLDLTHPFGTRQTAASNSSTRMFVLDLRAAVAAGSGAGRSFEDRELVRPRVDASSSMLLSNDYLKYKTVRCKKCLRPETPTSAVRIAQTCKQAQMTLMVSECAMTELNPDALFISARSARTHKCSCLSKIRGVGQTKSQDKGEGDAKLAPFTIQKIIPILTPLFIHPLEVNHENLKSPVLPDLAVLSLVRCELLDPRK